MAGRPGFMMYFDLSPALSTLSDEDAGKLFKAIMEYATSGALPDLEGICDFAFEVIRPRIDRDKEAYEEKCRKSSYSTYVRECKKRDEQAMSYEKWLESLSNDIERYHTTSDVNERYPTQHNSTQLQLNSTTTQLNSTTTEINNIDILPGAETTPAPQEPPASPSVITILLNDKSEYPITQKDVDSWKELYPSVDILQELRKMKGWADSNPKKRKTKAGIKRFINSWLSREQDRNHGNGGETSGQNSGYFKDGDYGTCL